MKGKVVLIVAVVFMILFIIMLNTMPKKKDWSDSFSQSAKKPYGSKLIKENLPSIFPNKNIEKVTITIYEQLNNYNYGSFTFPEVKPSHLETTEDENSELLIPSDSDYTDVEPGDIEYEDTETYSQEEKADEEEPEVEEEVEEDDFFQSETDEKEYVNNPSIQDRTISSAKTNYIFVNSEFSFDETDRTTLYNYVYDGNNVFLSANFFQGVFADTFHLKTQNTYLTDATLMDDNPDGKRVEIPVKLYNKNFRHPREYRLKGLVYGSSFQSIDTNRAEILGVNGRDEVNFIRIPLGRGYFYISAIPYVYTNYGFANKEMADYAGATLSYMPLNDVYWDEYYKVGRMADRDSLDFVYREPSLRWTWRLVIIGLLIYLVFESKRYQRVIPVLKKVRNTSVEFVYTIGRLYLQKGNHKDMAQKKVQFFLEYIRHTFYLPTHAVNDEFLTRLSGRTGIARKEIEILFSQIAHIQRSAACSKEDLKALSANIDLFKTKCKNR